MINTLLQESPIVINKNDWAFFMPSIKMKKMKFLIVVIAIQKGIEMVLEKIKVLK
jgi:hypothetical protein